MCCCALVCVLIESGILMCALIEQTRPPRGPGGPGGPGRPGRPGQPGKARQVRQDRQDRQGQARTARQDRQDMNLHRQAWSENASEHIGSAVGSTGVERERI